MIGKNIRLNNGASCPQHGFGTFMLGKNTYTAVSQAIEAGYRHIDTAYMYFNEVDVGRAINDKILDGTVTREEIFVTTKLWCYQWEYAEQALNDALKRLNLDYVDLYLVHNPCVQRPPENEPKTSEEVIEHNKKLTNPTIPKDEKYGQMDYVTLWRDLESMVDRKKARSIGLSNFNEFQINRLVQNSRIKPAMLQVETHPWHQQNSLLETCRKYDIKVTAFGPIGAPGRPATQNPDLPILLHDEVVTEIANSLNKSPAQILLRFAIQRGIVIIPKSSKRSRIVENGDLYDFELTEDQMQKLYSINKNQRFFPLSFHDHHYYPFQQNYSE